MNTINNPYKNKKIEFHILQSFPVTCLNRDDVGTPKTAVVGEVTRARVSSQCWKRAIRMAMHEISGVELGIRTKLLSNLVSTECKKLGATEEQAKSCGDIIQGIFNKEDDAKEVEAGESKSDTLMFLAPAEINLIATKFKENGFDAVKVFPLKKDKKGDAKRDSKADAKVLAEIIGKTKFSQTKMLDGLDIALFGRMVAQATSMNVEAASSFSHAISTHKVTNEVEFFTALDDYKETQGSAHMGSLEFNSATYYRYVSLDLSQLYDSLGNDEFFPEAITAFIKALYVAVPVARQTSQSGSCLWDFAKVLVRKGQGIQLSFETPVKAKDGGYLIPSIKQVKEELAKKEKLSGSLFGKIAEFEFGENENVSIDNLIESVVNAAKA